MNETVSEGMATWSCSYTCDLFSVTSLDLYNDVHGSILTSKVKGIKTTPLVRNQTHKVHHPSPHPRILSRKEQGEKTGKCSTFVPGHYSCIDTEGLLEADGEGRAAGYQETDIGRHLRDS